MTFNKNKKIPVIMLVGEGHSGSTLFDLIMDSHSHVVGVGELSHYYKHINKESGLCSCGAHIKDCEFWQKVFNSLDYQKLKMFYRYGLDFLLNIKKYFYYNNGDKKMDLKEYINLMEQIYQNILVCSGKKVIFDSSKNPERAELLLASDKLDIILLHLVRDGRGVVYSNVKLGRSAFDYIRQWAVTNFKIEIVKMRNKNMKNVFIKYEDFARNPEKILKYILKQVNLTFEPDMLNFRNRIHHQAGGNYKLRITTNDDKIQIDEKWKSELPLKDKIMFNLFFGWLNIFYKLRLKKY